MKIAVYGATGWIGSHLVTEALDRGHDVTAVSRHASTTANDASWQQGDAGHAASVSGIAAGHDVVACAIGPSRRPNADHAEFLGAIDTLAGNVGGARLMVVGGAGSLRVAPGIRLLDEPAFPAAARSEAIAHSDALELLRAAPPGLDWTYLSPAPTLDDGPRTGHYRTGQDEPAGARISAADYAFAFLDEIERPKHPRQRFTVAN